MAASRQNRFCVSLLNQYDPYLLDVYKSEMGYGIDRFFLLSYCLACCWTGLGAKDNLRIVKQWSELNFVFPSEEVRQAAIEKRFYVPGNSVPIDVDVQHRKGPAKSRIFVTIPRFDEGRPVTLGTVNEQGLISGYPDYAWNDNQGNNCDGLTSVFRVAVVDVRGQGPNDCSDTFVYVADVSGFGLLVVDVLNDRSWRVTHRNMYPYPSHGTFSIDGEEFDLMDGVLGMALSPYKPGEDRFLYFHALASTTENVVRTSMLRNESFLADSNANPYSINAFPEERPNQSAAEAMDDKGILYFGLMEPPGIWCWNSGTEFSTRNFHQIAINKETLQFSSGMKIVNNLKDQQELWVLTSSFQRVMTGSLSSDRINFRIHAEKIPVLLENSACNIPKDNHIGVHADRILPPVKSYSYKYGSVSFL